ncbi:endo-1,4-beta-xylanase [Paraglaciecola sp.]|uniref:endo-1,4-beta-xylanase n=1 Tax=Paraglaciecola sp. TaxID=1920173 RepID=UPI003EF748F1
MTIVKSRSILIPPLATIFVACGGGGSTSNTPPQTNTPPAAPANVAPVANAGDDQTIDELSVVNLSGSGTDSDGSINSYSWTQTSTGTSITLTNANTASASFTAPDVTANETITLELTVTDDDNATHKDSVEITITHIEPTDPNPVEPVEPEHTIPQGGTLISASNPINSASLWAGNGAQPVGTMTVVNVEHDDFQQALEVDITNPSGVSWNGQISIPVTGAVEVGDNVLLRVFFRTLNSDYETGTGFTRVLLQGPEPDYYKIINRNINSASEWVEYFLSATVAKDFADGELGILFELGAGDKPQSFQIGGVQLYNYEQSLSLEQLPNTELTYDGRDADAPWRTEALARIEEHRKGDFTLTINDHNGDPINNLDIDLHLANHAYHFGSAIASGQLLEESENGDIYREKVLELFNQAGPENSLKWGSWAGEWGEYYSQANTISALEWLKEHNIYARGHVLVWPAQRNLPNYLDQYITEDPSQADPQLLVEVTNHINDVSTQTSHLLDEWDVLNEPYDNHYLMDAFGDEVMVDWFELARSNLPEHKLYINDYSILSGGGLDVAHQEHYAKTIKYLVDNEAPIDGIGLQSHFSEVLTGIPKVYEILDGIHQANPNLLIRSTEFDVKTTNEQLQADYTRDFMTLFFSHPSTVGIQLWGFWAGRHWFPDAAMYHLDWTEKPNALVWKDLIFNQWHSAFNEKTDEQGQFKSRGFYGEYTLSFTHNDKEQVFSVVVEKGNENQITIRLPE